MSPTNWTKGEKNKEMKAKMAGRREGRVESGGRKAASRIKALPQLVMEEERVSRTLVIRNPFAEKI